MDQGFSDMMSSDPSLPGLLVRRGSRTILCAFPARLHIEDLQAGRLMPMVLILHDSSQTATTMFHEWTPKGLCKK